MSLREADDVGSSGSISHRTGKSEPLPEPRIPAEVACDLPRTSSAASPASPAQPASSVQPVETSDAAESSASPEAAESSGTVSVLTPQAPRDLAVVPPPSPVITIEPPSSPPPLGTAGDTVAQRPTRRETNEVRRARFLGICQALGIALALIASVAPQSVARTVLTVDSVLLAAGASATVFLLAAQRARARRSAGLGWLLLALATVAAGAESLLHHRPLTVSGVSINDAGSVAWATLSVSALWLLAGERSSQWQRRWVDGATVAFGVCAVGMAWLAQLVRTPLNDNHAGLNTLCGIVVFSVALVVASFLPSSGPRWLAVGSGMVLAGQLLATEPWLRNWAHGAGDALHLCGIVITSLAAMPHGISAPGLPGRAGERLTSAITGGAAVVAAALVGGICVLAALVLGWEVDRLPAAFALICVLVGLPRMGYQVGRRLGSSSRPARRSLVRPRAGRTDDLTGLANRQAVSEALAGPMTRPPEAQGWPGWSDRISLLLIDLDRFKHVNDALGHAMGDQLLTEVAQRIDAELSPPQMLARLGGDEFAVVLPGATLATAADVARTVRHCLGEPFVIGGNRLHVGASVGISHARLPQDEPADLLRQADVAMDAAKCSASGISVYDRDSDHNSTQRLRRIDELRGALERGDLEVHVQPQVDLERATIIGAEALARWRHPQDGVLLPASFLPLAAATGLMGSVAVSVIDRALAACATWWLRGFQVPISINLTADDLRDPDMPGLITAGLRRHLLPPRALRIEITEGALLQDRKAASALLAGWRSAGVGVAIDDYGTGYSSLAYLRELPVDEIKLDRSFINDLDRESTAIIVWHTVAMARGLNLRVVAEGVENEETALLLRRWGVHVGQGLYFGSAVAPDQFLDRLRTRIG